MTPEGIEQIKRHEGCRLSVYNDPVGLPTIGFGHLVKDGEDFSEPISHDEANEILVKDLVIAEQGARKLVNDYDSLTPRRQDALVNLTFNMGLGTMKTFKTFLRMMNCGEYKAAASALRLSKWHSQVKNRAYEIEEMIENG